MKNIHIFIAIFFIAIVINSCSIQKRVYMSGNYVCWNKKAGIKKGISDSKIIQKKQIKEYSIEEDTANKIDVVDLSLLNNNLSSPLIKSKVKILPLIKTNTVARISLKSAINPLKKIGGINQTKKLQSKGGKNLYFSLFVLSLLFTILTFGLLFGIFTSYTFFGLLFFGVLAFIFHKISKAKQEPKVQAKHGFAVASFILGLVSPLLFVVFIFALLLGATILSSILGSVALIGSVLSIIFGIIAIKRNKINPTEYQGKVLAGVGLFFAFITLMLYALFVGLMLNLLVI